MSSAASGSAETYIETVSRAVSQALGRNVVLQPARGGGAAGGGGATTSALQDQDGTKYFVKSAIHGQDMLHAEYLADQYMAATKAIRVPTPVAYGVHTASQRAFAVFEYLEFCGGGSQYELGQELARMHRHVAPNGKFGFDVDNTIGATFQPNLPWKTSWADFWDEHRLGHMLKLTDDAGFDAAKITKLRQITREILSHQPAPSLLHGDLWGGNKGFCRQIAGDDASRAVPCIFDPASYYGDREADVAMTHLFGGFSSNFYQGYESEWPLPPGHEQRRTVYNLYHILNHEVLFGGGYRNQARGMIEKILRMTPVKL
jgi:protein-ribulosamine 3-kinase